MLATANSPLRRLLIGAAFVAYGLIVNLHVHAQPNEQQLKLRDDVHQLCERSIADAFARIRPLIKNDHRGIADRSDLVLLVPYGEFNALAVYEEKRVMITWGFCDQLWLALDGMVMAELFPEYRDKFNPYLRYLSERTLAFERTLKSGKMGEAEILNFPLYAGIDIRRIGQKEAAIAWKTTADAMPNALAFVIAHEIGHLALEHRPYTKISSRQAHRQEHEADRFASRIMSELIGNEFDPMFSTSLLLLLQREAETSGRPSATHPPTHCRIGRTMLDIGVLDRIKDDPDTSRDYRRRTGYTPREAIRLLREMRDDCRD